MSTRRNRAQRTLAAVTIGLVMALTSVRPAQARMITEAGGIGIVGLIAIALMMKGGEALIAQAKSGGPRRAMAPGSTMASPAATIVDPNTEAAAPRRYAARPRCETVGGYEAYLKRTGLLCRLD